MTDLNLTPGISYRDYVQDSVTWDGTGGGPPQELSICVDGDDSDFIENAKNNRLRETAKWIFPNININDYTSEIVIYHNSLFPPNHAGFKTQDIGSIGLFNVSCSAYETMVSVEIESYITITLTDESDTDYVYEHEITNFFKRQNQRYQLRNIFIPVLDGNNEQRTDIKKVTIELKHVFISGSRPSPSLFDITIGRLWVGNFMPVCFDADWGGAVDNPSQINYSGGLDAHPVEQRRRRKKSYPIEEIDQSQAYTSITDIDTGYPFATFSDMQLQCGKDYPLVVSHRRERNESHPERIYPDPYVMFGLMSKDMDLIHVDGPLYQTQIDVVELI